MRKHELLCTDFYLCSSEVKISPALQKMVSDQRTSIFLNPAPTNANGFKVKVTDIEL